MGPAARRKCSSAPKMCPKVGPIHPQHSRAKMGYRQNLRLIAGEDRTLTLKAKTQALAILDLTGATITWRLSQSQGESAALEVAGSILSAGAGTYTVALTDVLTTDLAAGEYHHQGIVTIGSTTTLATYGQAVVEAMNQA